jgi:hypothetical protein
MVTDPAVVVVAAVVVVVSAAEDVVTSLVATAVEVAVSEDLSSDPQLTPATARVATNSVVRGRGGRMMPPMLGTKAQPAGSPHHPTVAAADPGFGNRPRGKGRTARNSGGDG